MSDGRNERCVERVRCPKCKKPKSQGCVYVEIKVLPLYARSPRTLTRQALTGKPTKVPHNERRDALRKLENQEMWDQIRAERAGELAEAKTTHDARRSYGAAVRQETEQLVTWLRRYGRILL
jgi:hypothetical protein